jgi:hypothetical protein
MSIGNGFHPIYRLVHNNLQLRLFYCNPASYCGRLILQTNFEIKGPLNEISIEESLDVTRIYSVADQLPAGTLLIRHPPLGAPHHTISRAKGSLTFRKLLIDRRDESLSMWILWGYTKALHLCHRNRD